jgi:hypothetical protein
MIGWRITAQHLYSLPEPHMMVAMKCTAGQQIIVAGGGMIISHARNKVG